MQFHTVFFQCRSSEVSINPHLMPIITILLPIMFRKHIYIYICSIWFLRFTTQFSTILFIEFYVHTCSDTAHNFNRYNVVSIFQNGLLLYDRGWERSYCLKSITRIFMKLLYIYKSETDMQSFMLDVLYQEWNIACDIWYIIVYHICGDSIKCSNTYENHLNWYWLHAESVKHHPQSSFKQWWYFICVIVSGWAIFGVYVFQHKNGRALLIYWLAISEYTTNATLCKYICWDEIQNDADLSSSVKSNFRFATSETKFGSSKVCQLNKNPHTVIFLLWLYFLFCSSILFAALVFAVGMSACALVPDWYFCVSEFLSHLWPQCAVQPGKTDSSAPQLMDQISPGGHLTHDIYIKIQNLWK